jgi:hypothetical protein
MSPQNFKPSTIDVSRKLLWLEFILKREEFINIQDNYIKI